MMIAGNLHPSKPLVGSFLQVLLVASGSAVEARLFSLLDGQTVEGTLQDYDLRTDRVTIQAAGRRTLRLQGARLADQDFVYVRGWDAARKFKSNEHFRVSVDGPNSINMWRKMLWLRRPGKHQPYPTYRIDFERIGYELKYNNRTGYDLEKVRFKYCIFYRQEELDYWKEEKVTHLVTRPCEVAFEIIPNEQQQNFFALKSVVLRDKEFLVGGPGEAYRTLYIEGDNRRWGAEFLGMILRIEMKGPGEEVAVREMRYPDDLPAECVWMEPTAENAAWPDDDMDELTDTSRPPTQFEERGGREEDDEES